MKKLFVAARLLKSLKFGEKDGDVQVELTREPPPDEMEQLGRVMELAIAELSKNTNPSSFPR